MFNRSWFLLQSKNTLWRPSGRGPKRDDKKKCQTKENVIWIVWQKSKKAIERHSETRREMRHNNHLCQIRRMVIGKVGIPLQYWRWLKCLCTGQCSSKRSRSGRTVLSELSILKQLPFCRLKNALKFWPKMIRGKNFHSLIIEEYTGISLPQYR